jgi:hypothetical protein
VTKPSEPPAGIARICGALGHHSVPHNVLDANLEGLLYALEDSPKAKDTWTRRAFHHLPGHLASLRHWKTYRQGDRYRRAVTDLNRLLEKKGHSSGFRLGLANCQHDNLSPARSRDLIKIAEKPEMSPFYPYFSRRLQEFLESNPSTVIGFSLNYLSQALSTFAMLGFLRRESPKSVLVLGGGLVTSWIRRPDWQNPFRGLVDQCVDGPGEGPLLSRMGVRKNEEPLAEHHAPDYLSLAAGDYLAPGFILPYSASSGCYWNQCSFCPERAEGNPYVPVPPAKVAEDLQQLVEEHRPVLIHLLDNAVTPTLMKTLCENLPGAPWYGFTRVNSHLADLDFCMELKRSGCVMLKLGLESGDQGVLNALHKGIDLGAASAALSALKRAGIAVYVYLLFGTPPESLTEARRTLDFVVRHHDRIDFLNLALFNLPFGSPEMRTIRTRTFYEGDLSLYADFDHPEGWDRRKVRQFLDKEFKRHPVIAPILRRDPPVFTSNHAPLFVMERKGGEPLSEGGRFEGEKRGTSLR